MNALISVMALGPARKSLIYLPVSCSYEKGNIHRPLMDRSPFWPKTESVVKSRFYRVCRLGRQMTGSFWNQLSRVPAEPLTVWGNFILPPSIARIPLLGKSQGTLPIPQCSVLKPKLSFLPQRALCLGSLSQSAYPELEPLAFENSEALAVEDLPAGLWSLTAFTNLNVRECL